MLKKSLMIFSFTFIFSNLSMAQNWNPRNPILNLRGEAIATIEVTGGYCRGRCPETKIAIFANGAVKATVTSFHPSILNPDGTSGPTEKVEKYHLLTLGKKALRTLKKELKKIKGDKELVDTNPTGPMCMDLPTTNYFIKKGNLMNSKIIKIAQDRNCKNFLREGKEGFKIIEILKSMRNILRIIRY